MNAQQSTSVLYGIMGELDDIRKQLDGLRGSVDEIKNAIVGSPLGSTGLASRVGRLEEGLQSVQCTLTEIKSWRRSIIILVGIISAAPSILTQIPDLLTGDSTPPAIHQNEE